MDRRRRVASVSPVARTISPVVAHVGPHRSVLMSLLLGVITTFFLISYPIAIAVPPPALPPNTVILRRSLVEKPWGLTFTETLQLRKVDPYSIAQEAGMLRFLNKVVTHANGERVTSLASLNMLLRSVTELSLAFDDFSHGKHAFALGQPVRFLKVVIAGGRTVEKGSRGIVMSFPDEPDVVAEVKVGGIHYEAKLGDISALQQDVTTKGNEVETTERREGFKLAFLPDAVFILSSKRWNAQPTWKDARGRLLYSNNNGRWMIGNSESSMARNRGTYRTQFPHGGLLPNEIENWDMLSVEKRWVPVGRSSEDMSFSKDTEQGQSPQGEGQKVEASSKDKEQNKPEETVRREEKKIEASENLERSVEQENPEEPKKVEQQTESVSEGKLVKQMEQKMAREEQDMTQEMHNRESKQMELTAEMLQTSPPTGSPRTFVPETRSPLTRAPRTRAPSTPIPRTPVPKTPAPPIVATVNCNYAPTDPPPRMIFQLPNGVSLFERQAKEWNKLPTWRDEKNHILFSSNGARWMVGPEDGPASNKGHIVSQEKHNNAMPHAMHSWQMQYQGSWMPVLTTVNCSCFEDAVKSEPGQLPNWLVLTSKRFARTFKLQKSKWNSRPMWGDPGLALYTTHGGYWMVGNATSNKGFIKSKSVAKDILPHEVSSWELQESQGATEIELRIEVFSELSSKRQTKGEFIELRFLELANVGLDSWECTLGRKYGSVGLSTISEKKVLEKVTITTGSHRTSSKANAEIVTVAQLRDPMTRFVADFSFGVHCSGKKVTVEEYAELQPSDRQGCSGLNNNNYVRYMSNITTQELSEHDLEKAKDVLMKQDFIFTLANLDQAMYMMKKHLRLSVEGYTQCWPRNVVKGTLPAAVSKVASEENSWDLRLFEFAKSQWIERWDSFEKGMYAKATCSPRGKRCWNRNEPLRKIDATDADKMLLLTTHSGGEQKVLCASSCSW